MDKIEWNKFQMDYVRLKTGIATILKLTNWRQGIYFSKPGLRFDVVEEDSEPVNKIFTTTSKRLIKELQPIIVKAEKQGSRIITVGILKNGEGLDTSYEVEENV